MRKRARAEEALYARENASESDNASDEDGEDSNAAAYAQQTTVEARTHGTGDHSAAEANVHVPSSSFAPNEKPLVLCSRGIPARGRHLMLDIVSLLPHCKKDSKMDTKHDLRVINEACELKNATCCVYFEARKKEDVYVWLARTPSGPTIKLHAQNIHTMAELKLTGNHLKGSRPMLNFSKTFNQSAHWQLMRDVLEQIFSVPKGHKRSKPFYDHVISFTLLDGRIWLRNYQVTLPGDAKARYDGEETSLTEVGPRVCLQPIKILSGSFNGPVLWENESYVSPNVIRAAQKRKKGQQYEQKVEQKAKRKQHVAANQLQPDELKQLFKQFGSSSAKFQSLEDDAVE